jgi:hypothetical protein
VNSRFFRQHLKNECQDIVEGSACSEMKEEMAHRIGAINVRALAALRTSGCTSRRKVMVIHLDRWAASGSHLGQASLKCGVLTSGVTMEAEESPLLRFVTRRHLVKILQRNSHC